MAQFMDVHHNMVGITAEQLREAHNADLAIQDLTKLRDNLAKYNPGQETVDKILLDIA